MKTNINYDNIVTDLVEKFPEIDSIYELHKSDNGVVLQHVFFGELTRFIIASYRKNNLDLVDNILEILDMYLQLGDDKITNLIVASFLENLSQADKDYLRIVKILPTNLQSEIVKIDTKLADLI